MSQPPTIERRLANLRAVRSTTGQAHRPDDRRRSLALADALASALAGEHVRTALGSYVRVQALGRTLPLDRDRLASLPGQPPPGVPLLCLDTETTGLATATGTFVFLVGVGRWAGDRFEQIQLLLPDQSEEPALLGALRDLIPPDGWLVTYNGRGFDWPLLVTRYRMARDGAPPHAGHLDLLSFVRRIFRHRLPDARLRTVERTLLGVERHRDVDGWEIPGRYLSFLRDGRPDRLVEVVRHNDEDVRSLARLLVHIADRLGDPERRRQALTGDLAALAAAYHRERRDEAALDCLEAALEVTAREAAAGRTGFAAGGMAGWRGPLTHRSERLAAERARTLRRLGRDDQALVAWRALATSGGSLAALAWVETAKLLEHRRRDPAGALEATNAAARLVERARLLGRPLPGLEADLARRHRRLRGALARARRGQGVI